MKNTNLKARWSKREINSLVSMYNKGLSYKKIAYSFNLPSKGERPYRTLSSVQQKLCKLQAIGRISSKSKKTPKPTPSLQQTADAYAVSYGATVPPVKPTSKLDSGTVKLLKALNEAKPSRIVITVGGVEITAIY
tara:strand:- start:5256 stop:5660 length:405 start_codon:yes stop_codon:yes gene_type:complete